MPLNEYMKLTMEAKVDRLEYLIAVYQQITQSGSCPAGMTIRNQRYQR